MKSDSDLIRNAVQDYIGSRRKVTSVEIFADPKVAGAYAIQAKTQLGKRPEEIIQFLIRAGDPIDWEHLEEVEFRSWPPNSKAENKKTDSTVGRLVVESTIKDIEKVFAEHPDLPNREQLECEFKKIQEEISNGDWSRIGILAGMLWYKLDAILSNLSTINSAAQNIDRNTAKLSSK